MGSLFDIRQRISTNAQRQCLRLQRRALTVVEVSLAFALLAIVLATSVRMASVVADHSRAGERRDVALQAAQAVSEQVGNIPWDQLTLDAVNQVPIPAPLAERLPNAKLAIKLADETDPVAKRVQVEISWNSPTGKSSSVRLTSWVFRE
jgi:hypothetical protein